MKYQGKITDPKDLVTKEYVDTGLSGKLGTSGDGSNVTAAFNAASSRTNISTGEKLSVIFGKIAKWFADLGAAAFRSVDSAPTANSTNLVESGGVKSALDNKVDTSDFTWTKVEVNQHGSDKTTTINNPGLTYQNNVLANIKEIVVQTNGGQVHILLDGVASGGANSAQYSSLAAWSYTVAVNVNKTDKTIIASGPYVGGDWLSAVGGIGIDRFWYR